MEELALGQLGGTAKQDPFYLPHNVYCQHHQFFNFTVLIDQILLCSPFNLFTQPPGSLWYP